MSFKEEGLRDLWGPSKQCQGRASQLGGLSPGSGHLYHEDRVQRAGKWGLKSSPGQLDHVRSKYLVYQDKSKFDSYC